MFIEVKVIIKRVNYMAKNVLVVPLYCICQSVPYASTYMFACFPSRSIFVHNNRCYIPLWFTEHRARAFINNV